jgi:hypothetical protein
MFAPREGYQFDWSYEAVELAGQVQTVKVAHLRLAHSRMFLAVAYLRRRRRVLHHHVIFHNFFSPIRACATPLLLATAALNQGISCWISCGRGTSVRKH